MASNNTSARDHADGGVPVVLKRKYDYGGNPLAREQTQDGERFQAFGGSLEPGLFRPQTGRKLGNPAPLGLSAFALTTFVLSLINLSTRGVTQPPIVVALAYAYGGLVQLLAGMWEFACGNTFGATALSSFGGFWISFGIIFTPGGFQIEDEYGGLTDGAGHPEFNTAFSFYLFGWFIFTALLVIASAKSTVAFFFLFLTLDLAFLTLALGYYYSSPAGTLPTSGKPQPHLITAGGVFGILSAFAAWYNALAGLLEPTNSFFLIPVAHFPWSEKGRERRGLPTVAQMEKEKEAEKLEQTNADLGGPA